MGFFSKLLGSKGSAKPVPTDHEGGRIVMSRLMASIDGIRFEHHRCGVCGSTCVTPSSPLSYVGGAGSMLVDVGGYCPKCSDFRCADHSEMILMDERLPIKGWGMQFHACGRCGTGLVQNEQAAVEARKAVNKAPREDPAPNLTKYSRALELEKEIDFSRVEKERLSLVESLAKRLSKPDLDGLVSASLEMRAGRLSTKDYNVKLKSFCSKANVRWDPFPLLVRYMEYQELAEEIDRDALQREMAELDKLMGRNPTRTK